MLPVAILAGGLATRLRPITQTLPKALVEVAGEPFIIRQLRYLRDQGVSDVVLCIGHLGHMISDVVGNGKRFGLSVTYSEDGPAFLGTGGALANAISLLGDHFFVLYGDSYLLVDYSKVQEAYEEGNHRAMMTVLKNQNQWDTSNVMFVKGRLLEYNKRKPNPEMAYIDYGLTIISSSALANHSCSSPFDLGDLYNHLSARGQIGGYEVHERFYEIGTYAGLKAAEDYFLAKERY
jgi:NDP-sugar pyrophosphorylase family protein